MILLLAVAADPDLIQWAGGRVEMALGQVQIHGGVFEGRMAQ